MAINNDNFCGGSHFSRGKYVVLDKPKQISVNAVALENTETYDNDFQGIRCDHVSAVIADTPQSY